MNSLHVHEESPAESPRRLAGSPGRGRLCWAGVASGGLPALLPALAIPSGGLPVLLPASLPPPPTPPPLGLPALLPASLAITSGGLPVLLPASLPPPPPPPLNERLRVLQRLPSQSRLQGARFDVPVVDTDFNVLHSIVRLAAVTDADTLVDLGCGDGAVLVYTARHTGARCVGFDIRRSCIDNTRHAAEHAGLSHRIDGHEHNFFDQEGLDAHPAYARASVVYAYLLPEVVRTLEPLLRRAVDDGKVVLLYCSTGCRIRKSTDRPAGNVIADLQPAGTALMGKLRLYCSAETLSRRSEMRAACAPRTQQLQQVCGARHPTGSTSLPTLRLPPWLPSIGMVAAVT